MYPTFHQQVLNRLTDIRPVIEELREMQFQKWKYQLFVSDIEQEFDLSNFQVAFLDLLSLKYKCDIYPAVQEKVHQEFYTYYGGKKDDIRIFLQGLEIPSEASKKWRLIYEDDEAEAIVNIYFSGWDFEMSTLIG
ncbi:hypothetical protein [Sediminitomix flava]|uniref:Uncharacterized protein n=1 Tax=Sediminitomix flava TaxID=379075 RepID=A0A315Z9Y1_SEDFL|nr:hypothetical protein [Sediminitomix flava]PWJ40880.1 hypothetical protein BC781_104140 [Sediminitomix flava]